MDAKGVEKVLNNRLWAEAIAKFPHGGVSATISTYLNSNMQWILYALWQKWMIPQRDVIQAQDIR